MEHAMALRSPWYVCERGGFDRFDPRAGAPAIQKYDTPEFIDRLLADPRDSLQLLAADGDVWTYPVPVAEAGRGEGRLRFATHRFVTTGLRKLYQPNHDRFYAVVVELFCDTPGLPRPKTVDDVEVGLVLRRRSIRLTGPLKVIRRLACDLAKDLFEAEHKGATLGRLKTRDVDQVLWADLTVRRQFEEEHAEAIEQLGIRLEVEGWMVGTAGAAWRKLGDPAPAGTTDKELELPMWRLPPRPKDCDAAGTRSLWFGLVPTFSGDRDTAGRPKLDDQAIYELRCFARRPPPPGRQQCPPTVSWSEPSEPFRLAAFADPEGTRNRVFSIRMPDFRSVAARAGQAAGPGGVAITSPPQSQLSFNHGNGTPSGGSVGGSVDQTCTFALEIFMIVAFFVFSLFLPIVVLLFQLWWLLALRFCLPPATGAVSLVTAFFDPATGNTMDDLVAQPPKPEERQFDRLLGARGVAAGLAKDGSGFPDDAGLDLVKAVDPTTAELDDQVTPEPRPQDPLCPPGT
jgi:hypothetical protein